MRMPGGRGFARCGRDFRQLPRHDRTYILFCQVWQRPGRVHCGLTFPEAETHRNAPKTGRKRTKTGHGDIAKASGKVTRPRREMRTERFPEVFRRLACYVGSVLKSIKDRAWVGDPTCDEARFRPFVGADFPYGIALSKADLIPKAPQLSKP